MNALTVFRPLLRWLAAVVCVAALAHAADQPVTIRLGTIVPRGTSYHRNLVALAEKWRQISGGSVKLNLFPDGTQGGEADMVGLMQTGNLDAGMLTAVGLCEIEPTATVLQVMPMMFRSLPEVDYVGDTLRPILEKRLLARGYVVIFWSDSGWVRFFSKKPFLHPDDLRKQRVFAWAGDTRAVDTWKAAGFQPVVLETAAIPQALMSGSIDAVPMPPFFALAGQLDRTAKTMVELNWAPLVGAAVVRQKTWEKIPEATREKLLAAAKETGARITADGRSESDTAVAAMVKRGLNVQKISPEVDQEWRDMIGTIRERVRGPIVPVDLFDETERLLKEYRANPANKP